MSSRRPGPLDYSAVPTPPSSSAVPAPPLVFASKTTPVEARLTSSQATTQPLLPGARGEPQVEANRILAGSIDAGSGSVESAASLLQSFKEDADLAAQKKKNGTGVLFGRGSPSSTRKLTDSGSVNKRYVKMGILLSDSPTGVSPYRSHHHGDTGISSPSGASTPPFSGELGETTDSTNYPSSQSTYPVNQSSSFSNQYGHGSACPSSTVDVSIRPYMEEDAVHSENGVRSEGYEVIDLKDVGSIVDKTDRVTVTAQPSPPISMKSESTPMNSEEPMSSPDSGYGNTPEYPNAGTNEQVKTVEERCKNGVDLQDGEERQRDDDGAGDGGPGATIEGAENGGSDDTLLQQQDRRNGEQLSRQSRGSSSSAVISDSESRGQRSRGNTDESLFSAESIISSPDGVTAPSSKGGGATEDTQVFMRPRTKLYLGRQHSVPEAVTAGVDTIKNAATTPSSQFSQSRHPMAGGRVHTSPSTGSLSGFVHVSNSPNNRYSQPVMSSPFGFSELHPSHPSHPSRTLPRPPSGHVSKLTSSQSFQHIQRRSPEPRRKKLRSSSIAFSKSAEVKLSRAIKSSTLSSQMPSEKDYFQVTDELSKENSHFALSEALLAVIEQYKANQFEQELELSSPHPPMSPLSPQPSLQSASTPGSMTDSPGSFGPAHPQWDTLSIASTSTTAGGYWTPPGSVGGTMPSWESFPNISTVDDPSESPVFATQQRSHRISLLELISSPVWDNSAESTAQRLLQHMATQLIGNESREDLNMSQMVLKLPTEFLTSLLLDEDLQKSVTTSSAHMRGNKEWAPPRNQIIYHIKTPSKNIHKDLAAQDYRCTGCGMKLEPSQARYFRFCTYTGRYFCHNCHTNATSIIPAYVMSKWSFKRYPVSNFARDLLLKFYSEPVFTAVPKDIYTKVPLMAQARDLRRQLVSIKNYLKTCRNAASLNLTFEGYAPWTIDLTSYSLEDFVEIKAGMKMKHLRSMLSDAIAHVKRCPLCRGKGFVCEFCQNSNDIIFPFELQKIRKCRVCDCCFHKECYGKSQLSCPRCLRLQKRLKQRQNETASPTARDASNNTSTNDYSSEVK